MNATEADEDIFEDTDVKLERGENMFEINITKLLLNVEAYKVLGGGSCGKIFVTHSFYDFEMVATPIMVANK